MKYRSEYFFCSPKLLKNIDEMEEIHTCIDNIEWKPEFVIKVDGIKYHHQTAYNKYGLTHNLLSIAVLVVPVSPKKFFPTRPHSISNMAEFDLAYRYFKLLPIPVPIVLIGLIPDNIIEV